MSKNELYDILGRFDRETANLGNNPAEDIIALRNAIRLLVMMVAEKL